MAIREGILKEYGATAERLRDVSTSHYKVAACYGPLDDTVMCTTHLLHALAINEERMLQYQQYRRETVDMQKGLLDILEAVTSELADDALIEKTHWFRVRMDQFISDPGG